ncbi:MAG: hydantoinase B/oxoprolinase family protein, partial [Pseudomonadota bacterium]
MSNQQKFDGVRLAILNNRWEGIARKMTNTLLRTGRSGVLNTARDFSCCIVTADDKLLATAESIPIHVLYGPDMMAKAMKELHPNFKPGDAFLHNSPYHGCSHPADHTILIPVFDDDEVHRYTVIVKAHQADIGNSLPTTYMGNARDVYEEGALIFPAVRVQENGRDVEDIIRMCKLRIRVPEQWWGDYIAMMGAARIGEREVKALAAEVGWETLHAYEDDWFNYSEQRMVEAIQKLPSGTVERSSTHDPLPSTPEEGITINVKVSVDSENSMIDIDLRNNLDALECGLNVSEACTRTAALIGVFNSLDPTVPRNAGSFRRVSMQLKENGVVGIPRHPYSCSVATTNVADRITNPVQCAIAELSPGAGQAETGALLPGTTAVISGKDPRSGKDFVNQLFMGHTAGAGSPSEDAWLTIAHAGNAGMLYIDSV